jgi:oligopeptidase B
MIKKLRHFRLNLILCVSLVVACSDQTSTPPVAKVIPKDVSVNGVARSDDYFWLRERENPEVISYLEAENEYTDAMMSHTKEVQETLYNEMVGRIKETDLDVPEKVDDYFYYKRTEQGKQYPIHCRKRGDFGASEEIILDQNELAAGREYFRIGVFKVSPNHELLAFSTDTTGGESYTVFVKNLISGEMLPDVIPKTEYSLEWANDNQTFFYSTFDHAKRPYKLFRHKLGTPAEQDVMIYHELDEMYFLGLEKSRSGAYLFLELESTSTTEVHYLDANRPEGSFAVVHPRQHQLEYYVEHHADRFYITNNDNAVNFKVSTAAAKNPAKANWRDYIAHRAKVKIDEVQAFENHLVVYEREDGLRKIRIADLSASADPLRGRNQSTHYVTFDEAAYALRIDDNPEFKTSVLRFGYTSLVTPESVFDYDMETRTRELKKQTEVLGGYDPAQYQSERIFAKAADGVMVPISLVYKKGLAKDGTSPAYLYAYGSYGSSRDPDFKSARLSLIDRGFVYAIAHIRGGGEMGRPWYDDGKLLKKKNTFTDFIACAEHLIAEKYTSADRLAAMGGSAGGLLMGAISNLRPDLFKVVVAYVPFVDVINTMLDESIPLTVTEFEEWGNPKDEAYFDYMLSYSPYDNVEAKAYPNLLITAGLNDPRVQYWEPAKWTAKLRATKTDNNRLLLKTNMGAGHGGASGRYDALKETAFEYAFVLDVLK